MATVHNDFVKKKEPVWSQGTIINIILADLTWYNLTLPNLALTIKWLLFLKWREPQEATTKMSLKKKYTEIQTTFDNLIETNPTQPNQTLT